MAPLLRLVGVLAYFWMAHRAVELESETFAGVSLALLVFIVYIGGLMQGRRRAWLASGAWLAAIWGMVQAHWAVSAMLFVPTLFLLLAARVFGRTLAKGRTPLLVTAASLIEGETPATLDADVRRYTTRQTWGWAMLLSGLAVLNLFVAMFAVPDGVLARLGHAVAWGPSSESVTRCVPWVIYLSVGGFLVGEFIYRQRRFPGRYKGPFDYLRKLARVPLKSWQAAFADTR